MRKITIGTTGGFVAGNRSADTATFPKYPGQRAASLLRLR